MPLPSLTVTPTPVPDVLFVDAGQALGPISPLVYGTNTGPWQNLSRSLQPYIEQAGFRLLRFPGGNWGDEYALSEQQLDEFIALCRQLQAEPLVHVRLYRAKPENAAKWVRYANLTRGYGIKYWAIGNEPSLYASKRQQWEYDTAAFNQQWREFALAMKAVDPSILLAGPETHQYTGGHGEDPIDRHAKDWMREFLIANGDLVDIVSFHRYPFGEFDPTINQLRKNSQEWDGIIPRLRQLIRETTGRDLPIAVTEVNSSWSNWKGEDSTPDSLYNAIWWSDVLGRLINQRVDFVAHFALEGAGGLGMLTTRGPRPIYHVYSLYQRFGTELVYASSDDPNVRIYAARRADQALSLMIVNLGPDEATKLLQLAGFTASGQAEAWRLDADHQAAPIDPLPIEDGASITLPGQSVTLFVLSPEDCLKRPLC